MTRHWLCNYHSNVPLKGYWHFSLLLQLKQYITQGEVHQYLKETKKTNPRLIGFYSLINLLFSSLTNRNLFFSLFSAPKLTWTLENSTKTIHVLYPKWFAIYHCHSPNGLFFFFLICFHLIQIMSKKKIFIRTNV